MITGERLAHLHSTAEGTDIGGALYTVLDRLAASRNLALYQWPMDPRLERPDGSAPGGERGLAGVGSHFRHRAVAPVRACSCGRGGYRRVP
jgi:hypothetical protein